MWTIAEVFKRIPQVTVSDYRWYIINFYSFVKLDQIDNVLKKYDQNNFLWLPTHSEKKRLQERSNQIITIDKPNYFTYGFIAINPKNTNIKELRSRINYIYGAQILEGSVFEYEVKQALEVAYKYNAKKKEVVFTKGSVVRINSGAFYGLNARVAEVNGTRVSLEVDMGQNTVQIITSILDIQDVNE